MAPRSGGPATPAAPGRARRAQDGFGARPGRALPGARARALETVSRLREEYPAALCALDHGNAWELLVATILSAQCTDARVNLTTPALFARYPDPEALAGARLEDVEERIRSTGFFHMKALAITEMSQDLVTRHGGVVPPRMEDLVRLRGVGRKTANVVLGVAFGIPGLPVDTHVARLSGRLRLSRSQDPVQIEADVCSLVPREAWTELSLRLILHGRRVCDARRPHCERCVLADICPSAGIGPARRSPSPGSSRARQKPRTARGKGATAPDRLAAP